MKTKSEQPHAALFYWKTFACYNGAVQIIQTETARGEARDGTAPSQNLLRSKK